MKSKRDATDVTNTAGPSETLESGPLQTLSREGHMPRPGTGIEILGTCWRYISEVCRDARRFFSKGRVRESPGRRAVEYDGELIILSAEDWPELDPRVVGILEELDQWGMMPETEVVDHLPREYLARDVMAGLAEHHGPVELVTDGEIWKLIAMGEVVPPGRR